MIILPREGSFGQTIGSSIGAGLSALADAKLQQMQKKQYATALQGIGLNENTAQGIARLPQHLQPLALKQHYSGLEALKKINAAQEASDIAKEIYGIDLSPEFLSTPQGEKYFAQIQRGEQRLEYAREKEASKPFSTGEALAYALSLGSKKPERMQKPLTILEKQQAAGALKKIKSIPKEERAKYMQEGFDVDSLERNLERSLKGTPTTATAQTMQASPVQSATGSMQQSEQQPAAGITPYATSAGIGALQSILGVTPSFIGQTAYQFGSGLTNLASRLLGGSNIAPSYEDLQKRIPTVQSAEQDALKLMKEYGLIPQDTESALPQAALPPLPTADQVVELGKKITEGTPLEKYAIPQTEGQQKAEDWGKLIPIFSGGGIMSAEGILGKSKEILKALAKSFSAKAAGEFTKVVSGSEALGDAVTFGLVLAHNLSPGSFKKNYQERYKVFNEEVINNPKAAGKAINPIEYDDKLRKIEKLAKNYARKSPERNAFDTQINKFQSLADENAGKINPESLWNNIKSTGDAISDAPPVVKGDLRKLYDLQKQMLEEFSTKVSPKGAQAFREANDLFRSEKEAQKIAQDIAQSIFPKQLSAGTAAFILGAKMPYILAAAQLYKGGTTFNKLLQNEGIRKNMFDLFKASANNNIQAANTLAKKIDTKIRKEEPDFVTAMEQYRQLEPQLR